MSDISFTSDTSPQKEVEEDQLLRRNIQVLEKKMRIEIFGETPLDNKILAKHVTKNGLD